jgi:hypothetical protein
MRKIIYFLALIPLFIFSGCDDCDCNHNTNNDENPRDTINKVLMLKVDYTTLAFEGGIEYVFNQQTDSFTIDIEYVDPGDFGSIQLTYQELNDTLFFGTIIWMGCGEMIIPEALESAGHFDSVLTDDVVSPINGLQNILVDSSPPNSYYNIWMKVQNLVKVRQFLQSNPNQIVKLFLYTPSVGMGDPLEWDYFIFLKN